MAKQSGFAKRLQARVRDRDHFVRQMCQDMAMIALNDAFGFGEERLARYAAAYGEAWRKWGAAVNEDAKDDPKIEYSLTRYEDKLKQICGKYYTAREERYK